MSNKVPTTTILARSLPFGLQNSCIHTIEAAAWRISSVAAWIRPFPYPNLVNVSKRVGGAAYASRLGKCQAREPRSRIDISSIGALTTLEISIAGLEDRVYFPASNCWIVSLQPFTIWASSSWVKFASCLYFFRLHLNLAILLYLIVVVDKKWTEEQRRCTAVRPYTISGNP